MTDFIQVLNDNAGAVMTALTFAYCVLTFAIVVVTGFNVREQRIAREMANRPYVTADTEYDSERGLTWFVLRNVGRSAARDVMLAIDPPFENPNHDIFNLERLEVIKRGSPVMVPGKEFRTLMGVLGDFGGDWTEQYGVTIRYRDDQRRRSYSDTFTLDISGWKGVRQSDPKTIHSLVAELAKVNESLSKIVRFTERMDGPFP